MKYTTISGAVDKVALFNKRIGIGIDTLVEQCEISLGMFPDELKIKIILCEDKAEVNRFFLKRYGTKVNYVAFMSKTEKTIWFSVPDARRDRLAHEFGHVIVETYLPGKINSTIHELLAQYCERHFND